MGGLGPIFHSCRTPDMLCFVYWLKETMGGCDLVAVQVFVFFSLLSPFVLFDEVLAEACAAMPMNLTGAFLALHGISVCFPTEICASAPK